MPRTPNPKRPAELQRAIVQYLIRNGLADLSLRPLAKAVGSSPRVLLYYFGSRENLIIDTLAEIRRRQSAAFGQVQARTLSAACRIIWKRMTAPASEPHFRLFFEAYGIALRHPRLYRAFLRSTIDDWLQRIADPIRNERLAPADARALATIILAGLRGFMLDYCTTHDRRRLNRALALWLPTLDTLLPAQKPGRP